MEASQEHFTGNKMPRTPGSAWETQGQGQEILVPMWPAAFGEGWWLCWPCPPGVDLHIGHLAQKTSRLGSVTVPTIPPWEAGGVRGAAMRNSYECLSLKGGKKEPRKSSQVVQMGRKCGKFEPSFLCVTTSSLSPLKQHF